MVTPALFIIAKKKKKEPKYPKTIGVSNYHVTDIYWHRKKQHQLKKGNCNYPILSQIYVCTHLHIDLDV